MSTINRVNNDPDPSRLIVGLRDTGYDFYTAAADIIDNSIAAKATDIKVLLELTSEGKKFVYFGDNGIGMDNKGLSEAMRYGAPARKEKAWLG
ncbi:ATP-binding protein [Gammaproteobacteria bacterium]|nr:ATP-binding protein [Gammaproteobacteria bacterium]|tara:strand:+ start:90 stop:368 length:279 start_codon:yes stop_codon:yes gene_type:complete